MSETISKEDQVMLKYLDNKEYQSKFLLDPDIEGEADFSHLDKNLAITNLMHNPKFGINEPEQARSILKGLHILNNPKHFTEKEVKVLKGYNKKIEKGEEILTPVYEIQKVKVPKFQKTYHALRSEFLSFVNTAAARRGHRINAAITNRLVKEETLTDKTEIKSKWLNPFNKRQ